MKTLLFLFALSSFISAKEVAYRPASSDTKVATHLTSFSYGGREIPLKIYFPSSKKPAPVILLSHGLGGSRETGVYLGKQWANAGYVVVAMQHVGSDESIWKDTPTLLRKLALKKAASLKTYLARAKDVPATLDRLEKWNKQSGHLLERRLNMKRIGLAGHSYGALTTQALAGQSFGHLGSHYVDKRIDAAFAMSPSIPMKGDADTAFASISIPMLLMTGTNDQNFISKASPESRQGVFTALKPLNKKSQTRHYQLVLKNGEHSAFSDRSLPGEGKRNPNHHHAIQIISTAFWDSVLQEKPSASLWLNGKKPTSHLEKGDIWLKK